VEHQPKIGYRHDVPEDQRRCEWVCHAVRGPGRGRPAKLPPHTEHVTVRGVAWHRYWCAHDERCMSCGKILRWRVDCPDRPVETTP
jgi:hypothetical protein